MNQFIIVGKVVTKPELKKTSSGNSYLNLVVEEERGYKNQEGNYDIDRYSILLWKKLAEECVDKIKKDAYVAVKGHLSSKNNDKDGITYYNADLTADKIVFAYDVTK